MTTTFGNPVRITGDQHEFESLVEQTRRHTYGFAYRLTGNRDDAEDLAQEAYMRAYRAFSSYDRNLPFRYWLFQILSNLFRDKLRRDRRRREVSLNQTLERDGEVTDAVPEIADNDADPERQYLGRVMDERLQRALARLPAQYRVAVLLRDVEEMSYEEIARRTRTSLGTVRSRIHRGRSLLRTYLTDMARQEDAG